MLHITHMFILEGKTLYRLDRMVTVYFTAVYDSDSSAYLVSILVLIATTTGEHEACLHYLIWGEFLSDSMVNLNQSI